MSAFRAAAFAALFLSIVPDEERDGILIFYKTILESVQTVRISPRRSSAIGSRKTHEVIRWARVNQYLQEFGFSPEVAKSTSSPQMATGLRQYG